MSYQLGVDLGTTFTSAATSRNGQVEALQLGDHSSEMPSVVYLGADGRYLVGDAAVAREVEETDRVAREFKRRIGDSTSIFLGGVPVSAHLLTGKLVGSVMATATARQGSAPDRVVVTCPANWGPHRREMLQQSLEIACMEHGELATEPEAAALHFAAADRLEEGECVAVYDLGGGTFDAAVLQRRDDGLHFLGRPEGLESLGGLNFDAAVMGHVWSQLGLEGIDNADDDPLMLRGMIQLREACVRAKERLSYDVSASIPINIPGAATLVRVTRTEFEELISPLVDETVSCLERTLRRAEIGPDELAGVLLVGGSSRIPLISERLTERLDRPLPPSPQPKLCVAMGAALVQGIDTHPGQAVTDAEPSPPPAEGDSLTAPVTVVEPPLEQATRPPNVPLRVDHRNGRAVVYAAAAAALLVAGVLLAWLIPPEPDNEIAWTREQAEVGAPQVPAGARRLDVEVLGVSLPRTPVERDGANDAFELSNAQTLFMAGPVRALLSSSGGDAIQPGSIEGTEELLWLTSDDGAWWRPLATIPGGAAVLAVLFSLAYGESLLRSARSHPGQVAPSEVLGMTGVGAVLGCAVAVLFWAAGRVPDGGALGLTALCVAAGSGLVPFAVAARSSAATQDAT